MKHLTVTTGRRRINSFAVGDKYELAQISSLEGWRIRVDVLEEDNHTERETARIEITLPDKKVFTGTIQDVMSIPAIISNAEKTLSHITGGNSTELNAAYSNASECISELKHLLSLFK